MPRVIFSITYPIKPASKAEYLETAEALKNYLTLERGKDYSIFEISGKPNHYSEVYICKSREEYELLEDDDDDVTKQLINRIVDEFILAGRVEYRTLIEAV